jgi:hypothetical protein
MDMRLEFHDETMSVKAPYKEVYNNLEKEETATDGESSLHACDLVN